MSQFKFSVTLSFDQTINLQLLIEEKIKEISKIIDVLTIHKETEDIPFLQERIGMYREMNSQINNKEVIG